MLAKLAGAQTPAEGVCYCHIVVRRAYWAATVVKSMAGTEPGSAWRLGQDAESKVSANQADADV